MEFLRNSALWVLLTAAAAYWLAVFALGPDRARDAVDIIAMVVGIALCFRLAPHAIDRFLRGGKLREWQVTMGMALFWASVVATALWGFTARFEGRPQWMIDSPINGFFRYWTMGSGLLFLSALSSAPTGNGNMKLYYVILAFCCGVLVGAAGLRYLALV
jgi:hypothetical protein